MLAVVSSCKMLPTSPVETNHQFHFLAHVLTLQSAFNNISGTSALLCLQGRPCMAIYCSMLFFILNWELFVCHLSNSCTSPKHPRFLNQAVEWGSQTVCPSLSAPVRTGELLSQEVICRGGDLAGRLQPLALVFLPKTRAKQSCSKFSSSHESCIARCIV